VLVVDDDPEFYETVCGPLVAAGWDVIWAPSGEVAQEQLRERSVAAALIDLHLPGISGFDLIREIAAAYPAVRIVAVSAIYREFYLEIARNVGAHGARRKSDDGGPVSGAEWLKVVTEVTGRRAVPDSTQ
jgi:DNA-binding response OmpR family regulator